MERSAFAYMSRGAVYPVEQMGAAWTRQFAFGAVHEAVQNERVVWTEQLGHLHFLRHAGLADPLEDVVFGYLSAGRQRATLRCNGLNLCPTRNRVISQRASGGPVFGAVIGTLAVLLGCPVRR